MKPIDYDAFFNIKELSAAFTSCIGYSNFEKKNYNSYTSNSESVKDQSYEVSSKKSSVNKSQYKQSYSDVISVDLASS